MRVDWNKKYNEAMYVVWVERGLAGLKSMSSMAMRLVLGLA